tara:strand:- start:133 stop:771 length:639 start_codon:yes stop_codon:yes gene_type:complete
MKNQNRDWDRDKLKFINMGWENELVEDARNPIKKFKTDFNVVDIGEQLGLIPNEEATVVPGRKFVEELSEPEVESEAVEPEVVEQVAIVTPPKEVKEVVLNVPPQLASVLKQRGVEYYCAPVVGKNQHTDDLYDDSYYTMQYGNKFVFDAVVIDMSDLELQFWCVQPITVESIVFPKTKEKGQRWWRVKDIEPKTGGYLCSAITSDTNPDFS